jgi:hypothetical protein
LASQRIRESLFGFAAACLAVALLQYMCLVETGFRRLHGNFTWQVLICTYLLFFTSIIIQFRQLLQQGQPRDRDLLAAFPFVLHVLCGLAYIGAILFTRSYY